MAAQCDGPAASRPAQRPKNERIPNYISIFCLYNNEGCATSNLYLLVDTLQSVVHGRQDHRGQSQSRFPTRTKVRRLIHGLLDGYRCGAEMRQPEPSLPVADIAFSRSSAVSPPPY